MILRSHTLQRYGCPRPCDFSNGLYICVPVGPGCMCAILSNSACEYGRIDAKVADGSVWKCPAENACPVNNTKAPCSDYTGSTGRAVVGHEFLLSTSTHTDGRRAFTLMNFDTAFSAVPTVLIPSATTNVRVSLTRTKLHLARPPALTIVCSKACGVIAVSIVVSNQLTIVSLFLPQVTAEPGKHQLMEVDALTGQEVEAIDDVPSLPGLQISLDVAEARVFLLGKTGL